MADGSDIEDGVALKRRRENTQARGKKGGERKMKPLVSVLTHTTSLQLL